MLAQFHQWKNYPQFKAHYLYEDRYFKSKPFLKLQLEITFIKCRKLDRIRIKFYHNKLAQNDFKILLQTFTKFRL